MKFDINNYTGRYYAMHCKTEEEAREFCNYLHSIGRKWAGGQSYAKITYYTDSYKGKIAYAFNQGEFCTKGYYVDEGYTILEFSDFVWTREFTKADLKTGDVVLRRNGDVEIVIKEFDVLIRRKECNKLSAFNEDLTHSFLGYEEDIVAVRRPTTTTDCKFEAFKEKRGTLVYERKESEEPEEMTLEQVCKLLGKEIKIIK